MPSSLASSVRDHLADYLSGDLSLEEFDRWFVPTTWGIDKTGDQPTIDLTYEIILRLAEYSNGECTEDELKKLLLPLAEPASAHRTSA